MIIDTHAHYDDEQFDADREVLLGMMQENGIGKIVNASAAISSWDSVIELTRRYPFVYGMIGVHPVSYTHLDVYKRQALVRRMWRWRSSGQHLKMAM